MKFYFKVRVSTYWEDPPEIVTYEHSLDEDHSGYADDSLQMMMTREDWLDQIPLPARLPDHDFIIIGIAKLKTTRDYWGEYDTDLDFDEIQYRSWPCDTEDGDVGDAPWKMVRLNPPPTTEDTDTLMD